MNISSLIIFRDQNMRMPVFLHKRMNSRDAFEACQMDGSRFLLFMLADKGYAAIFIATGVWRPKKLGIHGETLSNVHFGINYLSNPHACHIGKKVAVIGMGNVAMDAGGTAFRNGAESVTLYAHGKRIAA